MTFLVLLDGKLGGREVWGRLWLFLYSSVDSPWVFLRLERCRCECEDGGGRSGPLDGFVLGLGNRKTGML